MSIGNSGRIVIEIDPEIKRRLYSTLTRDSMTLKDWFLQEAKYYINTGTKNHLDLSPDVISADQNKNSL